MRLLRRPWPWFTAFALWFGVLWWMSSRTHELPESLNFFSADKILHVGYYFGGAGLISAALFRLDPSAPPRRRILLAVVIVTLVGVSDEFHQSFVPGRKGNDPFDLLADFIGALLGSLVFHRFRHLIA